MPTASLTAGDMPSLLAAIDTASQTPGTDWTVWLESGTYGSATGRTTIARKLWDGTVVDYNAARPFDAYLPGSRASVTGGSLTIRAKSALGAKIADRVQVFGSGPIFWNGLDFTAQADADQGLQPDGTTEKGQSHTRWQLQHTTNSTYPDQRPSLVRACRFGGAAAGSPPSRWIMGCSLTPGSVIEDTQLDGFIIGANADVIRRCGFRRQAADSVRIGFGAGAQRLQSVYGCTIWDECTDPIWQAEHTDAVQVGSFNTTQPISLFLWDNVILGHYGLHGIYCDDTPAGVGGWVVGNLIVSGHLHGLTIWRGDGLTVAGNTVVRVPDGLPGAGVTMPRIRTTGNSVAVTLAGNISHAMPLSDAAVSDVGGNVVIPVSGDAYAATFAGPFSGGAGWPVAKIDERTAATVRKSLKALFTVRA